MPVFSTSRYSINEAAAPDAAVGVDPWLGLATTIFIDGATGTRGPTRLIWIKTWDNRMYVRFSYDGVNFGDGILFDPDHPPVPLWYTAQSFQVRNAVAGSVANYSIEGYW